jgi:hypothetical protein
MSDKVRAWVWDLDLPPARKLILLWLAGRATDNGVAFPGERELRERTGLCERMVRYHLRALASSQDSGYRKAEQKPLLQRIERRLRADRNTSNVYILCVPWADPAAIRRDLQELKHVPLAAANAALASMGVGATGCREESSRRNSHRNTPPSPLTAKPQQQQQRVVMSDVDRAPETQVSDRQPVARLLVEAFYRGLGSNTAAVTEPLRRRDLAIACDLVAVGATPLEAESYAPGNVRQEHAHRPRRSAKL